MANVGNLTTLSMEMEQCVQTALYEATSAVEWMAREADRMAHDVALFSHGAMPQSDAALMAAAGSQVPSHRR